MPDDERRAEEPSPQEEPGEGPRKRSEEGAEHGRARHDQEGHDAQGGPLDK